MTSTATQSPRGRVALLIVGIVAALWSLGSAIFAIVQAVTEAASGTITVQLTTAPGYESFGIPLRGSELATGSAAVDNVTIPGLDPAPIIVHTTALIVIALAHLVLAAAAYVLARGLLRGLPFSRLMSRQLFASAVALLLIYRRTAVDLVGVNPRDCLLAEPRQSQRPNANRSSDDHHRAGTHPDRRGISLRRAVATRNRGARMITPLRDNRTTWWLVVVGIVVLGIALLCWNQISRTLGETIYTQLQLGEIQQLPRPGGGIAVITSYQISSVTVGLIHISSQLQWMLALEIVIQFLLIAAVLITIGVVWVRTGSGHPFVPVVTRSLVGLSIVVAVAGTGSELMQNFIAAREEFEAVGNNHNSGYYLGTGFTFTGTPLLIAIGIAILASAFAIGARISRERAALAEDIEGLV
jgi:hypothetical protein